MMSTAWATLRHRPGRWIGAFVTLVCAGALITSAAVLLDSGFRSSVPAERLAGADVVVSAPLSLRPPGGDLTTRASLPETPALPPDAGEQFSALPQVARVTPLPDADGRVIALGLARDTSSEPGEFDRAVATAADGSNLDVHRGPSSTDVLRPDVRVARSTLIAIASSFGGFAVLIAVVVVAGTMSLTMAARRGEFATLRILGCTPGRLLRMTALEGAVIGTVAAVAGVGLGVGVARLMFGALVTQGILPGDLPLTVGPVALAASAAVVILAAGLSAVVAAGPVAHASPVDALAQADGPARPAGRWRLFAGGLLAALACGAAVVPLLIRNDMGAAGTGSAGLALVVAFAVAGPCLMPGLICVALARTGGSASGWLARELLRSDAHRVAAVVTPLVMAVGFSLTMVHSQATVTAAAGEQARRAVTADVVLTGERPITPESLWKIAALPEVGHVAALRTTTLFLPHTIIEDTELATLPTLGIDGPVTGLLDPDSASGDLADLVGSTIALEHSQARTLRLNIDDDVSLYRGDGTPVTLKLVATYRNGLGLGRALVPAEVLRGHAGGPRTLLLDAASGVSGDELSSALTTVASSAQQMHIGGPSALADHAQAESRMVAWVNLLGLGVIVLFLAVSLVNTMVGATLARSRELGLMRLIGMPNRQVMSVLTWEVATLTGMSLVIGAGVAAVALSPLSWALLSRPYPAGSPMVLSALAIGAAAITACSILTPALAGLRRNPIDAATT